MNASHVAIAVALVLVVVAVANRRDDLLGASDDAVPVDGGDMGDALSFDGFIGGALGLELEPELEQGQGGGFIDWLAVIDPSTYLPTMTDEPTEHANVAAFLRAIRYAEGTADGNGYRALFGHRPNRPRLFDSFTDHPRQAVQFTDRAGRTLWTSAAGAYQFMAVSPLPGGRATRVDTWDRMARKLGLADFTPASQDAGAIGLIDEAGALNDVKAGRFDIAIAKVRRIWASLPGAGYMQGERSLSDVRIAYRDAGGTLA